MSQITPKEVFNFISLFVPVPYGVWASVWVHSLPHLLLSADQMFNNVTVIKHFVDYFYAKGVKSQE